MAGHGTPGWWVETLLRRLASERQQIEEFRRWYRGDQALPDVREQCAEAYRRFLRLALNNFGGLVVDAAADRMHVDGFLWTIAGGSVDPWRDVWQANELDAEAQDAHREALVSGRCPVSVALDGDSVRVAVEDPTEVICGYSPGRRAPAAALKEFVDGEGYRVVELMVPGELHRWRSRWVAGTHGAPTGPAEVMRGAATVPVRELRPRRPIGQSSGRSELDGLIPALRRIDKFTADKLVAAEFGAYRQRWVTGLEEHTDADGNTVKPWEPGADRVWAADDPDARFGEFAHTPLSNFDDATEREIQRVAAISRTPPHYLLGGMVNLSADAIRAAEAGLVTRVKRHQRAFGEVWEDVMRLALSLLGDARSADMSASTIWASAETRTRAELADALTKATQGFALPVEAAWAEWGADPQTIEQWRTMAARSSLLGIGVGGGSAAA